MSKRRMTPKEFKAEYKRRGWSGKEVALHWEKHPCSLSRIINDTDRRPHWDDAVRGLVQKQLRKKNLPTAIE
jgi:hypothetical protein